MIRVTRGDINILCDTQADLKIAMAALTDKDEELPAMEGLISAALAQRTLPTREQFEAAQADLAVVNAPGWRVGGPSAHNPVPHPYPVPEADDITDSSPRLVALPSESDDSVFPRPDPGPPEGFRVPRSPQHISVRAKQLEVLEAVLLFPEGVPVRGVAQLLGLTDKTVGQRMQSLKHEGLVEMVPHHHLWRATTLARRAKLVRA